MEIVHATLDGDLTPAEAMAALAEEAGKAEIASGQLGIESYQNLVYGADALWKNLSAGTMEPFNAFMEAVSKWQLPAGDWDTLIGTVQAGSLASRRLAKIGARRGAPLCILHVFALSRSKKSTEGSLWSHNTREILTRLKALSEADRIAIGSLADSWTGSFDDLVATAPIIAQKPKTAKDAGPSKVAGF